LFYWHINHEPDSLKLFYCFQCKLYSSWISGNSCSIEFMIDLTRDTWSVPAVRLERLFTDIVHQFTVNSAATMRLSTEPSNFSWVLPFSFGVFLATISEYIWPTFRIGFLRLWRGQCKFQTIPTHQALTVFFRA
jgi:hypothetical protein